MFHFPSPLGAPVFARTYSRPLSNGSRENWREAVTRAIAGLSQCNRLTQEESLLIKEEALSLRAMPSGRVLWVGGTPWHDVPANFSGSYNCTSTIVTDWESFGLMMNLAMMGCGTGAVLEKANVTLLPAICNTLSVTDITGLPGDGGQRLEETQEVWEGESRVRLIVGDSRQGWVRAYQRLLELASDIDRPTTLEVSIDLSHVRAAGEPLKGFGGTANPKKLPELWGRCARILNGAVGRQLTPLECCLLIDEAAATIVAGNIRRSAGIRQFSSTDVEAGQAKQNLWVQTPTGWRIDPDRDALRMANHTRVWHTIPDLDTLKAAVTSQFHSGEGAIMYAPEAIARSNMDVWNFFQDGKRGLIRELTTGEAHTTLIKGGIPADEVEHRLARYHTNPCVTADTWVLTDSGARRVADLVGIEHGTYINGRLFRTTSAGFFSSGIQPVVDLTTKEGYTLRLTRTHKLLKVAAHTIYPQDTNWEEAGNLNPGDRILIHNHGGIEPWAGRGTQHVGWLVGNYLGGVEKLSHWGGGEIDIARRHTREYGQLADIEETSHAFYLGFLRGLLVVQGQSQPPYNPTLTGGTVLLNNPNRALLQTAQRMLLRLGIPSVMQSASVLQLGAGHPYEFTATVARVTPRAPEEVFDCSVPGPARFDANGFVAHNCGEIIGAQFHCNLSEVHLNQLDPQDLQGQQTAFRAAALSACASLHHQFPVHRYQQSREWDPIVGVSITGLFDFCVQAMGVSWLQWWEQGRSRAHPKAEFFLAQEEAHLTYWRQVVEKQVYEYCTHHGLRVPNRSTTVQPGGTKSLLTGACPGWHPPKATRFIRRVTYRRDDPIALACLAYGYQIVPGQADKDEEGNLLNDPWDPRCTEWLVETPVEVAWANIPGVDDIDIDKFSAIAQFDFYMQVQKHYTQHNTSGTIEFREDEINGLAQAIHTAITLEEGYISVALLPRFEANSSYPRLPFEPISKEQFEREMEGVRRRRSMGGFPSFESALAYFDGRENTVRFESGPTPCDSEVCGI